MQADNLKAQSAQKEAENFKRLRDDAEKTKQSYVQLGEQIGSSIGNNLENAIMTGMKFKDVVKAIIQDMIRLAIQKTIVNSLTGGFGSFFGSTFGGGKALGGPVKAGTSYLVGEKGPELFTPGMTGNITPNGAGGGNSVVVNVNLEGGTRVQDNKGAGALGSAIAAAVRSELLNQKRPGGLLT
jgi:phage-related minor tail protein